MSLLPTVEATTGNAEPTHAVILLHGLGADGHDFAPVVPDLQLPSDLPTRFIFPHAPSRPVTVNGGMSMPAWYDILDIQIERKVDTAQLLASAEAVQALIAREQKRGIASERIVVAGFSQGGAVAYEAALSYPEPLAGLLAMSTYLATRDTLARHPANKTLPVLIQHGTQDPIVPEALGRSAHSFLSSQGYPAEYQSFPMPHAVCPQQLQAISRWLNTVLRAPKRT